MHGMPGLRWHGAGAFAKGPEEAKKKKKVGEAEILKSSGPAAQVDLAMSISTLMWKAKEPLNQKHALPPVFFNKNCFLICMYVV